MIVLLADGFTWEAIRALLGCSTRFIRLWPKRFVPQRLAGLYSRHEGRAPHKRTAQLEARILAKTRQKPRDGSTHWSTRKLAAELGVSHMMVARVWQRAGLAPHRLERYLASDDPHFEKKAADIIGLYLHPPQHAAVFCVDEKTAIQALNRLDPVLPLSPGEPNAMALSITATAPFPFTPPSTPAMARSWGAPWIVTPAPSSSGSYTRSWPANLPVARFTSSSIISPPTRAPSSRTSWP